MESLYPNNSSGRTSGTRMAYATMTLSCSQVAHQSCRQPLRLLSIAHTTVTNAYTCRFSLLTLTRPSVESHSLSQSPTAKTADRSADGVTYGELSITLPFLPPNAVELTTDAVVTVTAPTLDRPSIAACQMVIVETNVVGRHNGINTFSATTIIPETAQQRDKV